jgi:hypothetical protein
MIQIVSIVGSLMILAAYAANQTGRWTATRLEYMVLNLAGAAVLAVVAAVEEQWGFLLLEGVWASVSAYALVRRPAERTS